MRILYFSRDYTVHDQRFISALKQSGYEVCFLRLEKADSTCQDLPLPDGVELIEWAGGLKIYSAGEQDVLLADLERVVNQIQPDLIHAGPLHLSAYLAARVGFQALVSVSWGYDLLYDAPRSRQVQDAIRYTLQHSAVMVGDCNTIRGLAREYGMPDERIITFPWGVDLAHFRPQPFDRLRTQPEPQAASAAGEPFTLLSTRGWEPVYGIDVIVQAFIHAAREKPELRLVMLGHGSQAHMIYKILQDAEQLEKVRFPGQIDQKDLPAYYQQSDLYLSATHSDGASISLLEALACGKPGLVSDIPGNREWIEPGIQGWWFPDGDPDALAQAILEAVDQRSRLAAMGRAARALAEERADWDKNFPMLFKAYQIAMRDSETRV